MKALYTLLHNSQKRKMNFSLKILNILKLFTLLSIQEWHPCLLFVYYSSVHCFCLYLVLDSYNQYVFHKCRWQPHINITGKFYPEQNISTQIMHQKPLHIFNSCHKKVLLRSQKLLISNSSNHNFSTYLQFVIFLIIYQTVAGFFIFLLY